MKRNFLYATIAGLVTLLFAACEPNTPSNQGPIPESFPKKQLIEEFTGQGCGYCPYGMDCIHDFIANDTNWIVVLHHDGYNADNFTVRGSSTITKALKVDGAPSMCINRAKTNYGSGKAVVFHPAELESTKKSQFETTTYASVNIENKYNASTRELNIHVYGALCTEDHPDLYITVLIKESGMIDYQQDYYNTFEGWQEFRHTNAVRAFLTEAKGDELGINGQRYSEKYTITLDDKWIPENCMVVAFLSEAFQPVVQAEQRPVVKDTEGGANIEHGGILATPVPDYYPELNATDGPSDIAGTDTIQMNYTQASYQTYSNYGFNFWTFMAYNAGASYKVGNTTCIPFCYLYVFTEMSQKTVPYGTYELNTTMSPGTAWAGFRDDVNVEISGSTFYLTNKAYFTQGYLVPAAQWLIADGTLTVTEEGWTLDGHARNGSEIHLAGTTPVTTSSKAPEKLKRL